jgi:hypothetical protein
MTSNKRNRRSLGIAMKTPLLAGLTVSGLLLAAPPAHACFYFDCPDYPTELWTPETIDGPFSSNYNPLFEFESLTTHMEYSLPNNPDQTFFAEELIRVGANYYGDDYSLTVTSDISGNVPVGERYDDFNFLDNPFVGGNWGLVYDDIGVTPEAFLTTPFGNIDFPTAFVEAVGPTFFDPWASVPFNSL